jgi:hypothetical protein
MKWRGGCFVPSTPDCTLDMYYKYRRPSGTDYRPDSSPAQRRMERTCPLVDRLVPRIRGPQNRGPRRPKAARFRLVRLSSADVEARESSGWIGFFKWAPCCLPVPACLYLAPFLRSLHPPPAPWTPCGSTSHPSSFWPLFQLCSLNTQAHARLPRAVLKASRAQEATYAYHIRMSTRPCGRGALAVMAKPDTH